VRRLLPSHIKNINELQRLVTADSVERLKIKKISVRHYNGKVYDLHISNTNTYSLNSILSSNSGGGSLVCYLLSIHGLDPLKFGLSMDRFMASSRGGYMLRVRMD